MKRRPARGYTIIEVAVTTVATSVLLAVIATTVVMLLRGSQRGAELVAQQATIGRLAAQLRRDVQGAVQVEASDEQRLLIDSDQPVRIEYLALDGAVERSAFAAQRRIHRETYYLPDAKAIRPIVKQEAGFEMAGLSIALALSAHDNSKRHNLRIEAAVARDHAAGGATENEVAE